MIGMTLKDWLKENGYTQKSFAAHLGVAQSTISRAVNGRCEFAVMIKIYEATSGAVTPNWIILGKAA